MSTLHTVRVLETSAKESAATDDELARLMRQQANATLTETPVFCAHSAHGLGWAVGHTQGSWTMFRPVDNITAVPVDVDHLTELAPPELPAADTPVLRVHDGSAEAGVVVCPSAHGGIFVRFDGGIIQAVPAHQLARVTVTA